MTGVFDGLPKTLRVGHLKYTIKIVPAGSLDRCYGDTNTIEQVIRLERDMAADRAREVVLHEIMHAIWSDRNLGDRVSHEAAVTGVAAGLVSVLGLNPRLRRWFARELCDV